MEPLNCTLKLETSYRWTGCAYLPTIRLTQVNEELEVGHLWEWHWWAPPNLQSPQWTPTCPWTCCCFASASSISVQVPPLLYTTWNGAWWKYFRKNTQITWSHIFQKEKLKVSWSYNETWVPKCLNNFRKWQLSRLLKAFEKLTLYIINISIIVLAS